MAQFVTLLGFAAEDDAARLYAAVSAIDGPDLSLFSACGLVAVGQADSGRFSFMATGKTGALKHLHKMQRRMEAACIVAPFLPADPAYARCALGSVETLLTQAAPAIKQALARHGTCHQWDVVVRWQAEPIVAARRDEIARAAAAAGGGRIVLAEAVAAALARERDHRYAVLQHVIARVAVATVPAGSSQTEIGLTVLMPAGEEATLETALNNLSDDITANSSIDMRGPLPAISFASVRINQAVATEIAAAWRTLALPAQVDAAELRRHWRDCAARLHPDRNDSGDAPMAEASAAFRLLSDLLPRERNEQPWSLAALQRHAACRMSVHASENVS